MPHFQRCMLTGLVFSLLEFADGISVKTQLQYNDKVGVSLNKDKSFTLRSDASFVELIIKVGAEYPGFGVSKIDWLDGSTLKHMNSEVWTDAKLQPSISLIAYAPSPPASTAPSVLPPDSVVTKSTAKAKPAQDDAWENRWRGETDCAVGPVARKCCGPNATLTSENWCACKPEYGCDAVPACEHLRACSRQVAFHINVPRRCTWHNERSSAATLAAPESKETCIEKNHTIRLIHIDKTGGTSIDRWYKELYPDFAWRLQYPQGMGHTFRLGDGCSDECYVFVVRDPVKRWISRFLMRKRMLEKEYSRYSKEPWARELDEFPTPSALAEAVSSDDAAVAAKAKHIFMHSEIGAQKRLASWYLSKLAYADEKLRANMLNRIAFVATTTNLNKDFSDLVKFLQLPDRIGNHEELEQHNAMPTAQQSHAELSEVGAVNAEKLLSEDYKLLGILHDAGLIKQTCTSFATCEY